MFAHSVGDLRQQWDYAKTKLCVSFRHHRPCVRADGDTCPYAHSFAELRVGPQIVEEPICRYFATGTCRHGSSCRFMHTYVPANVDMLEVPHARHHLVPPYPWPEEALSLGAQPAMQMVPRDLLPAPRPVGLQRLEAAQMNGTFRRAPGEFHATEGGLPWTSSIASVDATDTTDVAHYGWSTERGIKGNTTDVALDGWSTEWGIKGSTGRSSSAAWGSNGETVGTSDVALACRSRTQGSPSTGPGSDMEGFEIVGHIFRF